MNPLKIVIGFIPQVVFLIAVNWLPLGEAAAVGLAAAAVLIAVTALHGGVKTLPVVQAVILALFTAVGFTVGAHSAATLEPYARGAASLALGAFILATCASFPFTAQFARASVLPKLWQSPQFLDVNRRISLAWGLAVLRGGRRSHRGCADRRRPGRPPAAGLGRPRLRALPGVRGHQAHRRGGRPPPAGGRR